MGLGGEMGTHPRGIRTRDEDTERGILVSLRVARSIGKGVGYTKHDTVAYHLRG